MNNDADIIVILEGFAAAKTETNLFGETQVNVEDIMVKIYCQTSLKYKFFKQYLRFLNDKNCFVNNDPNQGLSENGKQYLAELKNHGG